MQRSTPAVARMWPLGENATRVDSAAVTGESHSKFAGFRVKQDDVLRIVRDLAATTMLPVRREGDDLDGIDARHIRANESKLPRVASQSMIRRSCPDETSDCRQARKQRSERCRRVHASPPARLR